MWQAPLAVVERCPAQYMVTPPGQMGVPGRDLGAREHHALLPRHHRGAPRPSGRKLTNTDTATRTDVPLQYDDSATLR